MARIIKTNFGPTLRAIYKGLLEAFPQIAFGVLSRIGNRARYLMKSDLMSGQYIDLRKYPKDSGNNNTITYEILRKFKGVRISSYPLNLHNPRKAYNKFEPILSSKLDSIVNEYANEEVEKILETKEQEIERISKLFA